MTMPRGVLALSAAAFLVGPALGLEEASRPEDGSAFHTLRGVRDWQRVFHAVSPTFGMGTTDPATPSSGALCVVFDAGAAPIELLGDGTAPLADFLKSAGGGLRLGVLRSGEREVRIGEREGKPVAGLGWVFEGPSDPIARLAEGADDLLGEVRRGIRWLSGQPGRRVLLVVAERNAAGGLGLEATIEAARASGVAVFVAGPEAPYATPPIAMLSAMESWRLRDCHAAIPVHCDTKRPDLHLLSFFNMGAVFTWDARGEMHWIPEAYLEDRRKNGVGKVPGGLDLLRLSRQVSWPDDPPTEGTPPPPPGERQGRLPFEECTGFPAVPSGFGYWHLTRLAAMTGGKYLLLSRRVSTCPLRVKYDGRRLAEMSPSILRDPPEPPGADAFAEELRRLEALGLLFEGRRRSPEGGVLMPQPRQGGSRLSARLASPGEVATNLRECRRLAVELAASQRRLDAMRPELARESSLRPASRRLLGAVDATRVLVARARFHALAWARTLGAIRPELFEGGRWVTPMVTSRLCRFWEGVEKADAELRVKEPRTGTYDPEMSAALRNACEVTREVAREWEGTPVAAVAISGALWDYEPFVWSNAEGGRNADVGPAGGSGGPGPGTPSSGGSGTGSGD